MDSCRDLPPCTRDLAARDGNAFRCGGAYLIVRGVRLIKFLGIIKYNVILQRIV